MCGIAGILSYNSRKTTTNDVKAMTDVLHHRGPDGEGQWINSTGVVGLGHRRLSILDLSENGAQPMSFQNIYHITFNGEIYNYIEIRDSLKKKGYNFYTETDTEVILAAYHEYGFQCVNFFDGMFAFAIWDDQKEILFCARDRFGEKPFFYTKKNQHFYFASEMKALFTQLPDKSINHNMLYNYLAYDIVEDPQHKEQTFYKDIFKLEASHYLVVDTKGQMSKTRYWHIDPHADNTVSFEHACEQFYTLFQESVERRLRSDVPVGSSLSGGLDSSSVVVFIDKLLKGSSSIQKTFSARFKDPAYDEGQYMGIVLNQTAAKGFFTWPEEHLIIEKMDKIFYHQEEPFGGASIIAQWEVMRLAKENQVTVLLDGQGADEILGGYPVFWGHFFRELYLQFNFSELKKQYRAYLSMPGKKTTLSSRFFVEPWLPFLFSSLRAIKHQMNKKSGPFGDAFYSSSYSKPYFKRHKNLNTALKYYTVEYGLEKLLRFSDRSAMAHSREVRLPFLSHKLVEFLFSLPATYKMDGGWTKKILRHSFENVLPKEIAWRKDKLGFSPPQETWEKNKKVVDLIHESHTLLQKEKILKPGAKINAWSSIMGYHLLSA